MRKDPTPKVSCQGTALIAGTKTRWSGLFSYSKGALTNCKPSGVMCPGC
jgi:hypothetical protein